MTQEEMKAIKKYQALVEAEQWCDSHNVSKLLIKETENGYMVVKYFKC